MDDLGPPKQKTAGNQATASYFCLEFANPHVRFGAQTFWMGPRPGFLVKSQNSIFWGSTKNDRKVCQFTQNFVMFKIHPFFGKSETFKIPEI